MLKIINESQQKKRRAWSFYYSKDNTGLNFLDFLEDTKGLDLLDRMLQIDHVFIS